MIATPPLDAHRGEQVVALFVGLNSELLEGGLVQVELLDGKDAPKLAMPLEYVLFP